jgi:signal transduction histidine kinase
MFPKKKMETRMKSRFYLAFILAGIAPVLGLAGFYLYTEINGDSSTSSPAATSAPVNVAQRETEVQTIASSLFSAIKSANADASSLASHRTLADMQNFMGTHSGISGVVVIDPKGQALRTVPVGSSLIGPNYSSDPEFAKIESKFKQNGNQNYEFYTDRLGYPAFIFAIPLVNDAFAEVVLNIANFFKGKNPNDQFSIVDGNSGQFLYHSDPSKLNGDFNPQHEAWLDGVQSDLKAKKDGATSGNGYEAVYGYLHFGAFGVVHIFPLGIKAPAPAAKPASGDLSELIMSPMGLAFVLAVALLFIGAGIASRLLAAPFRRVVNVILAASEDSVTLTPEVVKSFGGDEAGQIVQALALYHEKIQKAKTSAVQSVNEQLSGLQRQTRQSQSETQEKTQQLTDKLKELEALKGMTEGLRNQNEQAKTEIGRLKGELDSAQTTELELTALQGKYAQLQTQLKEAQAKALSVATAITPIQVSQVRAAAIRTMSEELKNTLAIIKGYVSSVIGAGQGGVNEKQQEFLGMVINRSARLEKFINDLVDIYQVEIEQKDAKTEDVNLASEIETFAFNFQTQTELKDLKFKVEAKPGLPKVPVVRRRMIQLWNVLYLQLIKDSPKGSTISIVVEPVGDKVKVTVQDPGLVVTPEGLPRLFDEFYDPKHPASPQLAGTGLKMALVKTILTAHGGTAVAEKADIGTKLILTFGTKKSAGVSVPGAIPDIKMTDSPIKPAIPTSPAVNPVTAAPSPLGTTTAPLPPIPGLTVGAKPPAGSSTSAPLSPIPGLTVGAKPPAGSSTGAPLPPMTGITGNKPPSGDAPPAGSTLPPLPPIAGLTVGAKPPSAGPAPAPSAPAIPSVPATPKPVPTAGILDALISGKIPSVTAPGLKPGGAPSAAPPAVPPSAPKPAAPVPPPPTGIPGAPKPPLGNSLEDLLNLKPPPPPAP